MTVLYLLLWNDYYRIENQSRIECQFEAAATLARQLRTIIDDRS